MSLPNTFIIGAQKAGTTTLHDWLIQHPQVYGRKEIKDVDYFTHPERVQNTATLLAEAFGKSNGEKVVLHSCVNYLFYEKAIKNIHEFDNNSRLIVVLRNPVKRAFSAYNYFRKLNLETRDLRESLVYEPQERTVFSRFNNDFTYIEHGFYGKQLQHCLKYFSADKMLVLDFDDLNNSPEKLLTQTYVFLNIEKSFLPDFSASNVTGEIKNRYVQNLLTRQFPLKRIAIRLIDKCGLSARKRKIIREKLINLNTSKSKKEAGSSSSNESSELEEIKNYLKNNYIKDTQLLDTLLMSGFESKWFKEK